MANTTPAGLTIEPRQLNVELPNPLPRHWHGGDAFKSHLFDAMSVLFPDGERFFIESVRHFRSHIEDPALQQQIRGFIGQEGHHSREHLSYSQRLRDQGYNVSRIEKRVQARIRFTQRHFSPQRQLAATVALEHITAIMADALLRDPRYMAGAHPTLARLWRWHALEETEHKAVAFDVYMQVCGKRWPLRRAMLMSSLFFMLDTFAGLRHMLKADGLSGQWRLWRNGLRWMWGKEGLFRPLLSAYWDFFKADFHPWQHDNLSVLLEARQAFDQPQQALTND